MKAASVLQVMTEIRDLLLTQRDVFGINEVCLYTGLEKSYIYKLTSARKIPHFKSQGGKKLYFRRDEINEWLTQIRVKTIEEINLEVESLARNLKTKK